MQASFDWFANGKQVLVHVQGWSRGVGYVPLQAIQLRPETDSQPLRLILFLPNATERVVPEAHGEAGKQRMRELLKHLGFRRTPGTWSWDRKQATPEQLRWTRERPARKSKRHTQPPAKSHDFDFDDSPVC